MAAWLLGWARSLRPDDCRLVCPSGAGAGAGEPQDAAAATAAAMACRLDEAGPPVLVAKFGWAEAAAGAAAAAASAGDGPGGLVVVAHYDVAGGGGDGAWEARADPFLLREEERGASGEAGGVEVWLAGRVGGKADACAWLWAVEAHVR